MKSIIDWMKAAPAPLEPGQRRYDVDWLRIFALFALIIYHCAISFQSWGYTLFFPITEAPAPRLWTAMRLMNIWRIPLLFFIAGMGVFFSLRRRSWLQLMKERTLRILVPLLFGLFCIVPLMVLGAMKYYNIPFEYSPGEGHLWFLKNIYLYTLIFSGLLIFLAHNRHDRFIAFLHRVLKTPWGLILFAIPFWLEAVLVNPPMFTLFFDGIHGYTYGILSFLVGFLLALSGDAFRQASIRARYVTLIIAIAMYVGRLYMWEEWANRVSNLLIATESLCWIFTLFGFAARFLNRPSPAVRYLTMMVFPVYILHMPVQWWLSPWILPLAIPNFIKYPLLLIAVLAISILLSVAISYIMPLRPLFGLPLRRRPKPHASPHSA